MKTLLALVLGVAAWAPTAALAQMDSQPPMPMVVDLKKAEVGTWASYSMSMAQINMTAKFALVGRDASSVTMETTMEGGMMAMMGGKMTVKMVRDPDPTNAAKPVKQVIMQLGDQDPMLAPDNMPAQKFNKPDPKTVVGKETIKVAAGSFKTTHYRNKTAQANVDLWVSEDVPPMGLVKLVLEPGAQQPGMTMELQSSGKGAKPTITKPAKPFDPKAMMGGMTPPADAGKKKGKH
jgi:hypothetical protein